VATLILGVCVGLAATGSTTRPAPKPTTRPGKGFTITGVLTPPARVKQVRLIDRQDPVNFPAKQVRVFTAVFDRKTGRFLAEGLPRGFYDLMIETTAGRIDGINLRDTPDPFDLAPTPSKGGPLTKKDLQWVTTFVKTMKMFENKRRLLYVSGDSERAKAFVEKIRDEKTTLPSKEPQVFWRVEIWQFRKMYGGWRRQSWQVVYRRRMPLRAFRRLNWSFEPALGGLASAPGYTTDIGRFEIPAAFDPKKGRTPY